MGTALVFGITVTLRLIILGVEAFILGKPPPTSHAEKEGSVSNLCTIAWKRRYEQEEDVPLSGRSIVLYTQMMNTSRMAGEAAMQTNHPILTKQRDKRFLAWCFSNPMRSRDNRLPIGSFCRETRRFLGP